MTHEDFKVLLSNTVEKIKAMEAAKSKEYAGLELGSDRLKHFKEIATFLGVPTHKALSGMMAKHTKSIYDMLKTSNTMVYPIEKWDEKIVDQILYLILLRAIIIDNQAAHDANAIYIGGEACQSQPTEI